MADKIQVSGDFPEKNPKVKTFQKKPKGWTLHTIYVFAERLICKNDENWSK